MKCEKNCHDKWGRCWCCVEASAPNECTPCTFYGSRDEMYCEIPVEGDWQNRGFVMRIGCLCPRCLELRDDGRTEFQTYAEAIAEWNDMMKERNGD